MRNDATVAIIGGCGHVGLPLGLALANEGLDVTLIDESEERVRSVSAGNMPFLEEQADRLLPAMLAAGRLRATRTADAMRDRDVVVVTIGTPVDEYLDPGITQFDRAMDGIFDHMSDGQLMVLRSTVFPGVTERLARRLAVRGQEIDVAYCPERIIQGRGIEELYQLPQIVGGVTPRATERARQLFQKSAPSTIELTPTEAELGKLFANAHRYISFATSNQFYIIAYRFGADFDRIHQAVTQDYPRMAGFAKAGLAAGPCLLKDTMQLGAFNHNAFVLGQAAMMVNEGLPRVLVEIAKARFPLAEMRTAILGMAFKGDNDDPRDSLAYKLRKLLAVESRAVLCTDPYIQDSRFVPLEQALREAELLFVGACHKEYRDLEIAEPVIDVFGFLRRATNKVRAAGQPASARAVAF